MNFCYAELFKKNIIGIKLGFAYLNKFLDNLKQIENRCKIDLTDLFCMHLDVYDYRTDDFVSLVVNKIKFQNEVQEFYLSFVESEYLFNFSFYRKLKFFIEEFFILNNKGYVNSARDLSRIFLVFFLVNSHGNNVFSTESFISFFLNFVRSNVFSMEENILFCKRLLFFLEKKSLIVINTSTIFSFVDGFFDSVFFFKSPCLPFFFNDDYLNAYECSFSIEKLLQFTEPGVFSSKIGDLTFSKKFSLKKDFPEIFKKICSNSVLDLNFPFLEYENDYLSLRLLYHNKVGFNEYCFLFLIMSCFRKGYIDFRFFKKNPFIYNLLLS